MTTYWQIAAGADDREYSELFLNYGMAFVGTGLEIMREVSEGDIIILKKGKNMILAVGRVIQRDGRHRGEGDKEWLNCDGWDLPAYCYVDWRKPDKPRNTNGLSVPAITRCRTQKNIEIADNILATGKPIKPSLEPKTNEIKDSEIIKYLSNEMGLNASKEPELKRTMTKIKKLAQYYFKEWDNELMIREHEARTFLVIPLLLALGWEEKQLKIELSCSKDKSKKGKIDIACFSGDYRNGQINECVAIIETKGFYIGLDFAPDQAKSYAKGFPNCKAVIVTNGHCYKIYLKDNKGDFQITASSFLNIVKPRDRYPLDPENVKGALDAIKWLSPKSYL